MLPSRSPIPLLVAMLVFPFWGLFTPPTVAQKADSLILQGKALLQQGMNQNDPAPLHEACSLFIRATKKTDHTALAHYYVGLARYRTVNLVQNEDEQALRYVNEAINHLTTATALDPDFAEAYALLAGLYGQKIGLQPDAAMTLGPKSDRAMEQARRLAPENPRVLLLAGTSRYFKPDMFGGDKAAALEAFKQAARHAAQEEISDPLQPQWGHAEAYAWIGYAHMEAGRPDAARHAFEQALKLNPEFGWVKDELLPNLASAD